VEWVLGILALAALLAAYVAWLSSRIGRLHARVAAANVTLDAQLTRRANAAAALAHGQLASRPAAAEQVCEAARASLNAHPDDREAVENDLTRALGGLAVEAGDPAADELLAVSRLAAVARQVHNDAVRDTLGLRTARVPRALRLGSRHSMPTYFDIAEPTHLGLASGVGQATPGPGIAS
jgi:hypothetical protein